MQLAEQAALVPVATIERDFKRHAPQVEVFFPAVTAEGLPSPLHPLSSYAFPRANLPAPKIFALESSRYVDTVLRNGSSRTLAKVTDAELLLTLKAKPKAQRLAVGDLVQVLAGDWAGLHGRVAEVVQGRVTVYLELFSTRTLVTLALHEIEPL